MGSGRINFFETTKQSLRMADIASEATIFSPMRAWSDKKGEKEISNYSDRKQGGKLRIEKLSSKAD